ncbi:unnamed protein product, partial [Polarella glacialis]
SLDDPIRVYRQGGQWWSLDNRRLAAHQLTGQGHIPVQRVYLSHPGGHCSQGPCTIRDEVGWKKSTTNYGENINIQGFGPMWDIPYVPHEIEYEKAKISFQGCGSEESGWINQEDEDEEDPAEEDSVPSLVTLSLSGTEAWPDSDSERGQIRESWPDSDSEGCPPDSDSERGQIRESWPDSDSEGCPPDSDSERRQIRESWPDSDSEGCPPDSDSEHGQIRESCPDSDSEGCPPDSDSEGHGCDCDD